MINNMFTYLQVYAKKNINFYEIFNTKKVDDPLTTTIFIEEVYKYKSISAVKIELSWLNWSPALFI